MSGLEEHFRTEAKARPVCDPHHWVHRRNPGLPRRVAWVGVCSICGDVSVEFRPRWWQRDRNR